MFQSEGGDDNDLNYEYMSESDDDDQQQQQPAPTKIQNPKRDSLQSLMFAQSFATRVVPNRIVEPSSISEAVNDPVYGEDWIDALNAEIQNLIEHNTFIEVPIPTHTSVLGSKMVFKVKYKANGDFDKFKCRFVVKGYEQDTTGLDTFSPTLRVESLRTFFAVASWYGCMVEHIDIKGAFLYAPAGEDVYVEIPEGLPDRKKEGTKMCWHLVKSLYGLCTAPRNWYLTLAQSLRELGLTQLESDPCMFVKFNGEHFCLVATFVDDLIFFSTKQDMSDEVKTGLMTKFEINYEGKVSSYTGVHIERDIDGAFYWNQENAIDELLKEYGLTECKPADIPLPLNFIRREPSPDQLNQGKLLFPKYRNLVGSLLFVANTSRPDISNACRELSRVLHCPTGYYWGVAKRVLRYLKGTRHLRLMFAPGKGRSLEVLEAYSDATWGQGPSAKSVSGFVTFIGTAPISWRSKLQTIVAQSTAEAELDSICSITKEVLFLRDQLAELRFKQQNPTIIYNDNEAALILGKHDGASHNRSKHIALRYAFVRHASKFGDIKLQYIKSSEQPADILTKQIRVDEFTRLRSKFNLVELADSKVSLAFVFKI